MSLFDEIWRQSATPVLNEQFGESEQASYYDGSGTLRGAYDVLLSPEEAIEKEDHGTRVTRYQRTATLSWSAAEDFEEPVITTTGRLVVAIGGVDVIYSISSVLSRSDSGFLLVLQRGAGQRR